MRLALRIMLVAVVAVGALLAAAAAIALFTAPGLRWTLAAADALSGGAVQVERAEGRLIGPLRLDGVRVDAAGTTVTVSRAEVDWSPAALWRDRRLDVTRLDVQGVDVRLGPGGGEGGRGVPPIAAPIAVRVPDARVLDVQVRSADGTSVAIAQTALAARLDAQALTVERLEIHDVVIEPGDGEAVTIDEISLAAGYDGREVTLERLSVSAPRGQLRAQGTLGLAAGAGSRLSVQWSTSIDGRRFEGEGELSGDTDRLTFEQRLSAPAPLRLTGEVSDPFGTPAWQANAAFEKLDAGVLDARAEGVTLTGSLQVSGGPQRLALALRSQLHEEGLGPWDLSVDANRSDEAWEVSELSLQQRDGPGRLQGSGRISPSQGVLRVVAQLHGADIDVSGVALSRIDAQVDVGTDPAAPWTLSVVADGLALPGAPPVSVRAQGGGTASDHRVVVDLAREARTLHLVAKGGIEDGVWIGAISDTRLGTDGVERLRQASSAPARLETAAAQLSGFCLQGGASRACAEGRWQREGGSRLSVDLERFDLAEVPADLLPAGLNVDGVVTGKATVLLSGSQLVSADAALDAARLQFRHSDVEGVETVTSLTGLKVTAVTREDGLEVGARAQVEPAGELSASLRLPGWEPGGDPSRQRLDGEVVLSVSDLGKLAALIPILSEPQGSLDGRIKIAGTLSSPSFSGRASLRDGAAQVTRAGISVHDVGIDVSGDDSGRLVVSGSAQSGEGRIAIDGEATVAAAGEWSLRLHVTGTDFEALKRTDVQLVASPDVQVSVEPGRVELRGNVKVPRADVQLSAPKGTIEHSPDVVIVSEREKVKPQPPWKIDTRVTLTLGEAVKVHGYGFQGRVAGELTVIEEPGRATVADGELRAVDAKYVAYGQSLDIRTGRLVFAGGPIDNPSLDVRAVRVAGEVTAGVQVNGRLKDPQLSLFSEPALPDSDVLSYVVLGRPMNEASSAQGQVLLEAAAALRGGSGPQLVSRIAQTFGLSELRLTGSPTDKETALQLGRYLSPRLYLTYIIGLYDQGSAVQLRYSLTERLKLETTTGTNSSVDLLYSIER